MLRKGHKKQYKNLEVPVTSDLAKNLKNKEEAEREEKEKFKKLTLDINERLEEEDYQEMLNQVNNLFFIFSLKLFKSILKFLYFFLY